MFLLVSMAEAATKKMSCSSSRSLNAATASLKPGDSLLVSGFCKENVIIGAEVSRIVLDGQGTATINGADGGANRIVVRGRGITISGFTMTGGSRGI